MVDYKKATKRVYDKYAREFEKNTKDYLKNHILIDAELFIASLPGKKVLDFGSGPGRDSEFFKEKGINPLCFDISPEMIKLCRKKGLEAQVGDMENMPFERNQFDGVWAYASLLHIPKSKFKKVLSRINKLLVPQGVFYMGMKEGNFEGLIKSEKYGESDRFFALYRDRELRTALKSNNFSIMHISQVTLGKVTFLNYLSRKI